MTSMEKQQASLHFWSLTPPSSNSGCGGDFEAFGLHRPAQGGELQSALTCAPLSWPRAITPTAGTPGQGNHGPSPLPRRVQQEAQAAPAQAALVPAVPPLGLCLQVSKQLAELATHSSTLVCHTLRNLSLPRRLLRGTQWLLHLCQQGQQGGWACQTRAAHSLTL